jgi:transcriptional regulator with XRE-family HTH domain
LYVIENQSIWKQSGQKFKQMRLALGASIKDIASRTGASVTVISNFENGQGVYGRRLITYSYRNALELIKMNKDGIQ